MLLHYSSAVEFSGQTRRLFFLIPIGDDDPQYECVLLRGTKEVARFSFNEIVREAASQPVRTEKEVWRLSRGRVKDVEQFFFVERRVLCD